MRKQLPISAAAEMAGVSVNDVLHWAVSDRIYLGAMLAPFTADGRDYAGRELSHAHRRQIGGKAETCILPHEAKEILLSGTTTIAVWREPGYENGISIPQLSDKPVVYFLREPQTIGRDVLWVYEDEMLAESATPVTASEPAPTIGTRTHALKSRAHPLDAVIAQAEASAADASKPQSVWDAFVAIASTKSPPAPLLGYVDGEGIKYRSDTNDEGFVIYKRTAFIALYRRRAR
ncbi:hypothetical protein HUX88_29065 [Duganella sp. BJB1802]|uniref:hypothetical protein n=1 Tax=Duganella sp. BJB1802 TaxID=2744575 RepID=UPI001593C86A|nr:hypothetical protein [Duganella sp. BJB1802]NVD74539.1 hypothetical protein [Duganella sp. BJB1802]